MPDTTSALVGTEALPPGALVGAEAVPAAPAPTGEQQPIAGYADKMATFISDGHALITEGMKRWHANASVPGAGASVVESILHQLWAHLAAGPKD